MSAAAQTLYRAVMANPPTAADFMSNQAKGKPRRAPIEGEAEWSGISVYNTAERCRRKAVQFGLGEYVAELVIPGAAPIIIGPLGKGGHCTLWGEPEQLLWCVTTVVPV